jgi:outer membrane protein assembly factor BamB
MFAKTWPGWTFFNFAPKAGQIVVFNDKWTFGAQQFTQHHGLSPGFVAGGDGYLLVADHSDNEPVLKHEHRYVDQQGPGFTRRSDPIWKQFVPLRIRAMALAGDTLFLAGPPDIVPEHDPLAAFEGRKGASLWVVSTTDGRKLAEHKLDSPPVFDGMAAAAGRLYLCTDDGKLLCFGATK